MEERFWNGKRAAGISDTIDLTQYQSVVDVINRACKTFADRPAFTCMGKTMTYRDIDNASAAFAAYLQQHTTLKPGDRIAIQMPNVLQFPIAMYGALRCGFVVVNTNPMYTEREMIHQFNDSGAKVLVCMDLFARSVQNVLPETSLEQVIVSSLGDMLPTFKRVLVNSVVKHVKKMVPAYELPQAVPFLQALAKGRTLTYNPVPHSAMNDTVILQYTGGTTGVAKGAELTNQNLIANMLQARSNLSQVDNQGTPLKDPGGVTLVAPLPLYHVYSFTVHLMAFFEMGDHSLLITNPRDIDAFIKAIKPHAFTGFIGLNTLFVALMNHPEFKRCDFSKLRFTLSGGTALAAATGVRWREMTGVGISEAYGLTETSPAVCINPSDGKERSGTVGPTVASTAVKCIDDAGNEVPIGERGELCVRGPQVMKGYWNRPDATKDTFTDDGEWLKTGDVAVIDEDGYVSIVDRIKDMVLVSGFNVYPNEIEDVVSLLPQVQHSAVIGVPDDKTGEALKLFVVTMPGETISEDAIIEHCRTELTSYKVPRLVEFRDELPMTNVGKILRRELRDEEMSKHV